MISRLPIRYWLGAFFLLIAGSHQVRAQNGSQDQLPPKFIPKSPTLTSVPRYDEQRHVDLMTGAAQLLIPLTSIGSGSLQLPISLAYSYAGLQVYQPQQQLGLGWSLQAGATVSLQVTGLLDGKVANPTNKYSPETVLAGAEDQAYLKRMVNNEADGGPDVYSFAIPGGPSGRFIMRDTLVILLPKQPVHIRSLHFAAADGIEARNGFQVTTEAGVRYQFLDAEHTHPSTVNFSIGDYTSAWQLTRIISTNYADTLRFHYSAFGQVAPLRCAMTTARLTLSNDGPSGSPSAPGCLPTGTYDFHNIFARNSTIISQYLDSITTRSTRVVFQRDPSTNVLQLVRLLSLTGGRHEVKRFTLFHSLFSGPADDPRLRLDALQESANSVALPPHRFQYNTKVAGTSVGMPARGSSAQDQWGYFNGAFGNGTISNSSVAALLADPVLKYQAANRNPDYGYAKLGALEVMTYPTGGQTRLEYEPNRIGLEPSPSQNPDVYYVRGTTYVELGTAFNYEEDSSGYIPGRPIDNLYKLRISARTTFQVTQAGDIVVSLSRDPTDPDNSNGSGSTNRYKDFDIWRVLPGGDELISTSFDFRSFDPDLGAEFTLALPPGLYAARVYCERLEKSSGISIAIPTLTERSYPAGTGGEEPGPGLRVKRTSTTAFSGASPLVRTYAYRSTGAQGMYGSGMSLSEYGASSEEFNEVFSYGDGHCRTLNISSDHTGLGDEFNKCSFYYKCVTEQDSTSLGKTVSFYEHRPNQFNEVVLVQRQYYRQHAKSPLQLQLAQEERSIYRADSVLLFPIIRARQTQRVNLSGGFLPHNSEEVVKDEYASTGYNLQVAFEVPIRIERTRYDEVGKAHTTISTSGYAHQRLVRTATSTNTGWQVQRYRRLNEYAASTAIVALRANHFNPVVETQTWRRASNGTDSTLIQGHLTFFDPLTRQAAGSWSLRLGRPVAGPNAMPVAGGLPTSFKSDTRYQAEDSVRYDPATGLLQERRTPHGPVSSYVWGDQGNNIVAQVENATFAQVRAVLGQPTLDRLLGRVAITDADLQQLLQPLRTQLPQARVTTFTYLPLIGVTTQISSDGRMLRYEYDALGRLLRTRDEQGRILTQQQYQYAKSPTATAGQ